MALSDSNKEILRGMAARFEAFKPGTSLVPSGAVIEAPKFPSLKSTNLPTYKEIKSSFKPDLKAKDSRFNLSGLVANQLSVEEEEAKRFQDRIEEEVQARIKIIKAEAHSEGFAKGSEEGKQQAFEAEKFRLAEKIENFTLGLKSIAEAKLQLEKQYEAALVDLALKLATVVIHAEVSLYPEKIAATVHHILEKIAKEDDVRIRLPQNAYDCMEEIKKDVESFARDGRVAYDVDATLPPGSCVVESLSGEITSVIDEKIKKLTEELTKRVENNTESQAS